MMRKLICACLLLAVSFFCVADDYIWYNPNGGDFGESTNWNYNLVPGSADRAFFPFMNMPYTVTFDQGYENKTMFVDGAELTFNLNGQEYYLNCDPQEDHSAYIGRDDLAGEHSYLTLNNGRIYSRDVSMGYFFGSFGHLTLSGADAQWTTSFNSQWHGVTMGHDGQAYLSVLDNAYFSHGHGASAIGPDSSAIIDVNGLDSEWHVDGQFDMSAWGDTTVDILNGGLVNIGKLTMALERGSSAQINITGQNQDSELHLHAGFENSLAIGKSGRAGIRVDGSRVWNQGTMTIAEETGSRGLLEIHEGATVFCDNSVAVGGNFNKAGGTGRIELFDDTPGNGIEAELRVQANGQEDIKVWPRGTIALDGGSITVLNNSGQPNPLILQGGTIEGNGVVWGHVENRGGLVVPSDEYNGNRLSFAFDYTQDAGGALKIALGSNDHYPAIQVNNPDFGQANLDGMLDVELTNGFVPDYGDMFTIIIATNISGTFINAPMKYVFEDGSFDVTYNADSVILTHFDPQLACPKYPSADFNKDCMVNIVDFSMFADQWLACNLDPASSCP